MYLIAFRHHLSRLERDLLLFLRKQRGKKERRGREKEEKKSIDEGIHAREGELLYAGAVGFIRGIGWGWWWA